MSIPPRFRGGYAGTVLYVDLTRNRISREPLDPALIARFIGGRGIGSWLLYDGAVANTDPSDPENPLIFSTGPLTGTLLPASSRFTVTGRSPLTRGHGDANAGGFFGPELKAAGIDHIVFTGRAVGPVYLRIENGQAEIRDARHLWGKDTWETQRLIRKELEDEAVQIACIGPAGENLVPVACIIHGLKRAAAKAMGPIMGSKQLKAVAVRGTGGVRVAEPDAFFAMAADILKSYKREALTLYGTANSLKFEEASRAASATKNLQTAVFPGLSKITPDRFNEQYLHRLKACFGCHISCGRTYKVRDGEFAGLAGEGPELAAFWAWGSQLQVDSLSAVLKSDVLSNQMGIDCIETGDIIAFAMECYQRGILTDKDLGGLRLDWGDFHTVHALIGQIARKEGFGEVLGKGMRKAAEEIGRGAEYYAREIKGHSFPSEMRGKHGSALGYLTSTRGADHLRGLIVDDVMPMPYVEKHFGKEALCGDGVIGKGKATKWIQDMTTIPDLFGVCKIVYILSAAYTEFTADRLAAIYEAATGLALSGEALLRASERVYNVEQAFNVLHGGFSAKADRLPKRLFQEAVDSGPGKGKRLKEEEIAAMLDEYYGARGWDRKTTAPTRRTLDGLDLGKVADDLERFRKAKDGRSY